MALDGIIFDVDGTLADTNGYHVDAWLRAFEGCGYKVLRDRVEIEIGKGGDQLVPSILGREAERKDGEKLRSMQTKEFQAIAAQEHFELFEGAEELLRTLRDRGFKLAIAYAFIGVIAAEFIMATSGLGYSISYAFKNFENGTMYGLMLFVILLVKVVNAFFNAWESRMLRRWGR